MSCVLSICTAIVTILLLSTLPIEIGCCGLTTNEIISLMHQNPDYKQDPCYIEWKDSQDEKLTQLWTRRAELEKSMAEYNRKRSEYDRQERENRQRSYLSTSKVEVKKETSLWKVLGIIAGFIVGMCCCAACIAAAQSDDQTSDSTTNNAREPIAVPLTTVATRNTWENQTTSNENNNFTNLASPSLGQQAETNVPLMPRRQNSLPSYEDVIRMPSAPPKE